MAEAKWTIVEEQAITLHDRVLLILSVNEAQTLADVLSMVSGSPVTTRRKHVKAVTEAMRDLNINFGATDPGDERANNYHLRDRKGHMEFTKAYNAEALEN